MKRFLILCTPRTGSNNLFLSLNLHPQIFCEGEIDHLKTKSLRVQFDRFPEGRERDKAVSRGMIRFFKYFSKNSLVGLKLFPFHLNLQSLSKFIPGFSDIKIIYLHRLNFFEQMISYCVARRTNNWTESFKHAPRSNRKIDLHPFRIDEEEFLTLCKWMKTMILSCESFLTNIKNPRFEITYENSLTTSGKRDICSFLSVSQNVKISNVLKKTDQKKCHMILNYKSLRDLIEEI